MITLPTEALMPEQKFMGVGCEACHGPGGLHVEAVQKKDTTHLHMDKLGTLGGVRTNDLCGRCHRTEQDVVSKNLNQKHTDLFQAHGLAQSRCFRESGDKLTCITCHDPHTNVNENHKTYIPACLKCHAGPEANSSQLLAQAKICPVNPKDNCIQCHMPKRSEPVFPGSPRRVADHFIRAYRAGANPLDTRTMQSSQPPKASAPNLR